MLIRTKPFYRISTRPVEDPVEVTAVIVPATRLAALRRLRFCHLDFDVTRIEHLQQFVDQRRATERQQIGRALGACYAARSLRMPMTMAKHQTLNELPSASRRQIALTEWRLILEQEPMSSSSRGGADLAKFSEDFFSPSHLMFPRLGTVR
jgi:hypothetical protein